jgi:hypothetical protein
MPILTDPAGLPRLTEAEQAFRLLMVDQLAATSNGFARMGSFTGCRFDVALVLYANAAFADMVATLECAGMSWEDVVSLLHVEIDRYVAAGGSPVAKEAREQHNRKNPYA